MIPVQVQYESGKFFFPIPFKDKDHAKRVVGAAWDRSRKCWFVPASPQACRNLQRTLDVTDAPSSFYAMALAGDIVLKRASPSMADVGISLPADLWDHQKLAIRQMIPMLKMQSGFLYAAEMGCGKTRVVLEALSAMNIQRTLVVAPLSVVPVWEEQAARFMGDHFHCLTLDKGRIEERAERLLGALTKQKRRGDKPLIACLNYDILRCQEVKEVLAEKLIECCVLDESHRAKGINSQISQVTRAMPEYIPKRIALTGTPLSNGNLGDVFRQAQFLDPGVFGTQWGLFLDRFAIRRGPTGKQWVERWVNHDEFNRKFWTVARHESAKVLDLPETVEETYRYELKGKGKTMYDKLEREFLLELEDDELVWAENAAVRLMKLNQVANGFVIGDSEQPTHVHNQRQNVLAEILGDIAEDEPVVVYGKFKADIEDIHKAAFLSKRHSLEFSGSVKQLDEWKAAKGGAVLAVQIDAGAEGIDLTKARYCVYYSLGWDLKSLVQSRARVHRPGQERTVVYVNIVATGTVDEMRLAALKGKQDLVASVVAAYKEKSE